jgi:hypothetical protein
MRKFKKLLHSLLPKENKWLRHGLLYLSLVGASIAATFFVVNSTAPNKSESSDNSPDELASIGVGYVPPDNSNDSESSTNESDNNTDSDSSEQNTKENAEVGNNSSNSSNNSNKKSNGTSSSNSNSSNGQTHNTPTVQTYALFNGNVKESRSQIINVTNYTKVDWSVEIVVPENSICSPRPIITLQRSTDGKMWNNIAQSSYNINNKSYDILASYLRVQTSYDEWAWGGCWPDSSPMQNRPTKEPMSYFLLVTIRIRP